MTRRPASDLLVLVVVAVALLSACAGREAVPVTPPGATATAPAIPPSPAPAPTVPQAPPTVPAPALPPLASAAPSSTPAPTAPPLSGIVVPPEAIYVCVDDRSGERTQRVIEFAPRVLALCRKHPEMGPCQYERNLCRQGGGRVFAANGQEITMATEAEYDRRVLRVRFPAK